LAFKIFDTTDDKKVSQKDMFELMHISTKNKKTQADLDKGNVIENQTDTEILPLGKQRSDIFMDLFSSDYIKILKQIDKKKLREGNDAMTPKVGGLKKAQPKLGRIQHT
jgi:hypothetical protein